MPSPATPHGRRRREREVRTDPEGRPLAAGFSPRDQIDVCYPYNGTVAKLKRGGGERGPREDRGVLSARIVAAARASFSEHGWAGTTLRGVARDAGVDLALVTYYFSDKRGLLAACLVFPAAFTEAVAAVQAAPVKQRGRAF